MKPKQRPNHQRYLQVLRSMTPEQRLLKAFEMSAFTKALFREGLRKRYVTRLSKLAFIAPAIAEAIAAGRTPTGLNLQMLMDGRLELTPCWSEQERIFSTI